MQWRIPHIYSTTIGKLEYFTEAFAEKQRQKLAARKARKMRNEKLKAQARKVQETVSIEQVLEDSVLCAAFHRYLVSVYAEENLLFYGATQIFEKGRRLHCVYLFLEELISDSLQDRFMEWTLWGSKIKPPKTKGMKCFKSN